MQNKQNRIEQKKTVLRRIEAELLDILKSTGHLARQKLKFLSIVYKNVLEGRTVTKRSIYYSSVNTFGKQAIVDNLIKYYSRKLESDVTWLNIVPGCKGLFCGTISLISDSNEMWYSNTNFIPRITTDTTVAEFNYKTVLVVEKESIFQRMVEKTSFLSVERAFQTRTLSTF
ncbi:REC12 [Enterospora canceri]|uniref:REC12 n=1 Tax=Enterospora canceri TaxID=1081671 RepID=A0A1Y1S575_9MICR|nr:REC12 [Enterospora canceri]